MSTRAPRMNSTSFARQRSVLADASPARSSLSEMYTNAATRRRIVARPRSRTGSLTRHPGDAPRTRARRTRPACGARRSARESRTLRRAPRTPPGTPPATSGRAPRAECSPPSDFAPQIVKRLPRWNAGAKNGMPWMWSQCACVRKMSPVIGEPLARAISARPSSRMPGAGIEQNERSARRAHLDRRRVAAISNRRRSRSRNRAAGAPEAQPEGHRRGGIGDWDGNVEPALAHQTASGSGSLPMAAWPRP